MGNKNLKNRKGKKKKKNKTMSHRKWILIVMVSTIIISAITNILSESLLEQAGLKVAFVILITIVFVGVFFDTIGTAVTAAKEAPFHAMASKKIKGAKTAIKLIKNADKVSNFCNDVIGDICGIISGSASGMILLKLATMKPSIKGNFKEDIARALLAAATAALTIGGKALGKNLAINKSNEIIFKVSKVIYMIKKDR